MVFKKALKERIFTFTLTEDMRNDLQKLADRENVTPSFIIRQAIDMVLKQDQKDQESNG